MLSAGTVRAARGESQTSTAALTLDEALARARASSKDLKLAKERVSAAEVNIRRAWALLKPRWDASFTYTHTEPQPPPFEIPAFPDFTKVSALPACQLRNPEDPTSTVADPIACSTAILGEVVATGQRPPKSIDFSLSDSALFRSTVQWTVFNGQAFPLIANGRDQVSVERSRYEATLRGILLAVARTFYAARAASEAVDVAERALQRSQARLAVTQEKAGVGEASTSLLRLEQIATRQAEIDLGQAEVARSQAFSALAFLTGASGPIDAVAPPPPQSAPKESIEELSRAALDRRDDVRAARLACEIAERAYSGVYWKFAPVVSLFGTYRWTNVVGFSAGHDEWTVGVMANLSLYDGGLRYADLADASSALRSATFAKEKAEESATQEVTRAKLKLDAAELGLDRAQEILRLAEERASLTRTQLFAGAARDIELQDALDQVRNAEIGVVSARLDRDVAILELLYAAGLFAP